MIQQKEHIVLITSWFPPLQSVAVNRMLAFAKYLDKEKFDLTVITAGNTEVFGVSAEYNATVHRIKPKSGFWKPSFKSTDSKFKHYSKVVLRKIRMKFVANEDKDWSKAAAVTLNEVAHQKSVDVIISSFSPVAPHLVALAFCKKHPATKWIVDMRDEMSLNPQTDEKTKRYYAKVEKEINQFAHALISVSEPIVNYFKEVLPDLKMHCEIRNGFDHEMPNRQTKFNETFTILHAGSFYGARKPDTFFKALENLNSKNQLPASWKFICAGASRNFSIPATFKSNVAIIERVAQTESLELMANADLNLLIQPPTGRKGVYTGKVFDYLSVGKPILAVVDETDVAADLIRKTGAGYVAHFTSIEKIEIELGKAIANWKSKKDLLIDREAIKSLHRKIQVQKLNGLIEKLLNEH